MKLILFDVDGTIAESGQKIDDEMTNILINISKDYELGIVGGGTFEKIKYQLGDALYSFTHIFSECGCVYYKNDDNLFYNIHTFNLRNHETYSYINILIKESLNFISKQDYTITGHFVDLRNGIVYISLIGMDAIQEERKYFLDLDKEKNYRKKLVEILNDKAKELNVHDKLDILEGGTVGVGIYPKEFDKVQALKYIDIKKYAEVYYFGDKYQNDGNDYNIINDSRIVGMKIDSVEMTKNILKNI